MARHYRQRSLPRPGNTGERLLRERPKICRQVVRLLSEGWSANKICKRCHVTRETAWAVESREAEEISARKKASLGSSATLPSQLARCNDRNWDGCGQVLALTGQMPSPNIVNIPMPTAEERAEMRALDRKLDAIAAKLKA